jgi:hypothetical protein
MHLAYSGEGGYLVRSVRKVFRARKRLFVAGVLGAMVLLCAIVAAQRIIGDPDIALIYSEHGADWIRFRQPIELRARKPQTLISIFRTRFELNEVPRKAILSFRAMKHAVIRLNNELLYRSDSPLNEWKKVYHIDLTPRLRPGANELLIAVQNRNGHAALLAYCKALKLVTGERWETSTDGRTWTQALSVHKSQPLLLSRRFQPVHRAFFSHLHFFIPVFIVVFACSLLCGQQDRPHWLASLIPTAKRIRWMLLGFWLIMAINNIGKIPLLIGMDINGHMEYVRYVAENRRIPLATEGWQMFQPPLFYIISAIIFKCFLNLFSYDTVARVLRAVPLLCGAAQIELSYRALQYVYPKREDLQVLGTVIGGLLPMSLYCSQVATNEPMAGCISGIVVVLTFRFLRSSRLPPIGFFVLLGFVLGLALLTKTTAVLLIPPLVLFIGYPLLTNRFSTDRPIRLIAQRIAPVLGVAILVSGWYYVRNWIHMGQIFIGGWDPSRGIVWWQDPGFRTVQQFFTFGQSLFYPIYSAISGVWDSLYSTLWMDGFLSGIWAYSARPPWNYGFLLSSAWLSLLPSAAILLGILAALCKPREALRQGLLFAICCMFVYVTAILYLFLTIPIYSTAKATYTLGLVPCYAVLSAGGFDIVTCRPVLRATVYGIVACWAVGAYLAYFVL